MASRPPARAVRARHETSARGGRRCSSSAGEHTSTETLRAANVALWQVEILNQLVGAQQAWHVRYAVEIIDKETTDARRELLANGAATFSFLLHGQIGGANYKGGWYRALKEAVDADINGLDQERGRGRWTRQEWWLAFGDVVAVLAVVAAVVGIALAVADAFEDEGTPQRVRTTGAAP